MRGAGSRSEPRGGLLQTTSLANGDPPAAQPPTPATTPPEGPQLQTWQPPSSSRASLARQLQAPQPPSRRPRCASPAGRLGVGSRGEPRRVCFSCFRPPTSESRPARRRCHRPRQQPFPAHQLQTWQPPLRAHLQKRPPKSPTIDVPPRISAQGFHRERRRPSGGRRPASTARPHPRVLVAEAYLSVWWPQPPPPARTAAVFHVKLTARPRSSWRRRGPRNAKASTSCATTTTTAPCSTSSWTTTSSRSTPMASRPVVGSSRSKIFGRWSSAFASATRCLCPRELVRSGLSANAPN